MRPLLRRLTTARRAGLALVAALVLGAGSARAQQQPQPGSTAAPPVNEARRINGRVVRPGPKGQDLVGVPGIMVTLHRVGPDGAGPLDSMRTAGDGRYRFAYRATGSADAVYFTSVMFDGIAYFSSPTRAAMTYEGDASITVFDTTSRPLAIKVAGHHFVVAAPRPDGKREVAEVFELLNDTSLTLVSSDSARPTWLVHLPPGATETHVTESDIAPGAADVTRDEVRVFAPLSPGIRQLALMYVLPKSSFPLQLPVVWPTRVLEVLAEEPTADVSGASLTKRDTASTAGRTFQRWLAEDVPASAVVSIDFRESAAARQHRIVVVVGSVLAALMAAALFVAFGRRKPRPATAPAATPGFSADAHESLVREIALLDASWERDPLRTPERAAEYDERRRALKARLAALLAAERGQG